MYDDIKSLNKSLELIFGWRILLLSINAGFIILSCSNTIILKVSLNLEQLVIDTSSVINGILSIVAPIWIMQVCDSTENECQNLIDTLLKLAKQFPQNSNEKKELQDFSNDVVNRKIKFTAARFFNERP
ncbi:uncharacterized protein LOC126264971 [Aethina tumida]|uniref:uncharacterized protein LOC126264971 n=1 Tax=Aethina tumida TaxID=116153 RepID=UPI0021473EA5|nr:uncharacterized protein LOC126264971 [Aethina tumida]